MGWKNLTMRERSDLMSLFLDNDISSLKEMRHIYDGTKDTVPMEVDGEGNLIDSISPAVVSESLSRNEWNDLYRQGKVLLSEVPRRYQSWVEGNNGRNIRQNARKDRWDKVEMSDMERAEFYARMSTGSKNSLGLLRYPRSAINAALTNRKRMGESIVDLSERKSNHPYGGISYIDRLGSTKDIKKDAPTDVDFVTTFFTGKTPFEEYGVIKDDRKTAPEVGRLKSQVSRHEKHYDYEMPIFQTFRDTIPSDIVRYADSAIINDQFYPEEINADEDIVNDTGRSNGFNINGTPVYYDSGTYQSLRVKLPDGRVVVKNIDLVDFTEEGLNYPEWIKTKFLEPINSEGRPYLITTPWFLGTPKDSGPGIDSYLEDEYGIIRDSDGRVYNPDNLDIGKILEEYNSKYMYFSGGKLKSLHNSNI